MLNTGFPGLLLLFFTCCFLSVKAMPTTVTRETLNDRPVIGILTQQVSDEVMKPYGRTYIPAAYVKYIESGGSRVMPIRFYWRINVVEDDGVPKFTAVISDDYKNMINCILHQLFTCGLTGIKQFRLTLSTADYENIFTKINGLLFIGGAVDLEKSDYARVAKIFYKLALKANSAGDFFPIWGTCMGLQLLTVLVAGENLLTNTLAENIAMPLNLTTDAYSSRMFEDFSHEFMQALTQEPLTGNFHHYGVTVKNFEENEKLQSFFSILSSNVAVSGAHFVSTIEGKKYPFYGVQWHPEVNRFQWNSLMNFPHSPHAVQLSSRLAEFFVNEGRRSLHRFDNPEEEAASLIYNYTPMFAGNFTGYEQIYFF